MIEYRRAFLPLEAIAVLREWLDEPEPETFARLEIEVPEDVLIELAAYPRVRWESRSGDLEIRGWGVARQWESAEWPDASVILPDLGLESDSKMGRALRWFVWGRFDAGMQADDRWSAFGTRRAVLPLIELRRTRNSCFLACNRLPGQKGRIEEALARKEKVDAWNWHIEDSPRRQERRRWEECFSRVQDHLAAPDGPEKIVLARYLDVTAAGFDPGIFVDCAKRVQPDGYAFLIEPEKGTAFFGLSPERLFHRRGRRCESEALAGTRPRGATDEADARFAAELAASDKDRREQGLVLERILADLEPLAERIDADAQPSLRRLHEVQHLCSTVRAKLREGVGDGALLDALHPTPAVAGQPPRAAQTAIAAIEGFDRGLYAGPVGCASVDETEIAVAIRSGLWCDGVVRLIAGAGLLPASDARAEWEETEAKMALFLRLLLDPSEGLFHEI